MALIQELKAVAEGEQEGGWGERRGGMSCGGQRGEAEASVSMGLCPSTLGERLCPGHG